MDAEKKYFAFISYKREDEKWAKWLQHKLEHYRFPTNLNGRTDLPKSVRPTFRDVTDLKPGFLAEEISNALNDSQWLIIVCSPRSAKSPWVCKEARTFIEQGRADHIIPFVVEGIPFSGDEKTECYPEALLELTGRQELLAANINEVGR
ncbi:MAG: toll/interleukin-1 receptor domain-containing protein, partial [Bacteroidaceae bacterium]|nr:toll/interleukin-1 receptor domain-containing protein [Bacteroidaceae bacterium]